MRGGGGGSREMNGAATATDMIARQSLDSSHRAHNTIRNRVGIGVAAVNSRIPYHDGGFRVFAHLVQVCSGYIEVQIYIVL